jgi:hypothetical protein
MRIRGLWVSTVLCVGSMGLVCAITSCGGTAPASSNAATATATAPPAITISIDPPSATVSTTLTKQFTSTVSGTSNTAVSWSVNGVVGGNQTFGIISASGLYTAPQIVPTPSTFTITATSQAAASVSAAASVMIVSRIGIIISPQELTLVNGTSQFLTASVTGRVDSGVVWNVNGIPGGDASVGTIATTRTDPGSVIALYAAPNTPPASEPVKVNAVSTVDPAAFATARVTIKRDNQLSQDFPIKLGTSGGNASDFLISGNMIGCCSGTLGSLISRGGNFYILSNNHVLDKSDQGQVGDPISQPGLGDVNCRPQNTATVAHLSQATVLHGAPSNVDAALAQIVPDTVDTTGTILDLAGANRSAPPSATLADPQTVVSSHEAVAKVGRSSGLTCSTITSIATVLTVKYETSCGSSDSFEVSYTNQIVVSGSSFAAAGDSGSLVVTADTARPVGLLFAGNSDSTALNPIEDVLSALKDPSTSEAPQIVGAADHSVACPTVAQSQAVGSGPLGFTPQLDSKFVQRSATVEAEYQPELMQDPAVAGLSIGMSDDDPSAPAVVLHVSGVVQRPVPHQVGGIRTKIVFDQGVAAPGILNTSELVKAAQIKAQHSRQLMSSQEVFGVGVGSSQDSPGEAAIVIYVDRNSSIQLPVEIDGTRTRIVRTDAFRTSGWGKDFRTSCGSGWAGDGRRPALVQLQLACKRNSSTNAQPQHMRLLHPPLLAVP